MKKIVLIALLLSPFTFHLSPCSAQRGNAFNDNTFFWSFDAGATFYKNMAGTQMGVPYAGLNFGRWLMRPLAFRISGNMAMAPSYFSSAVGKSDNAIFIMGRAEFMWDINATFFHVYNKRFLYPIPFYPLIGLGAVYRTEFKLNGATVTPEHDFHAMLGLHMPVRISPKWDLYAEYKCNIFAQGFDGSVGDNFMHSVVLGLKYRVSDDPFRRRTAFESRSTNDDWFVGFGAGVSFSSFGFEYFTDDRARYWNFTPEIMVGRNYTSVWTIRFELSGFFARERAWFDPIENEIHPGHWYTFNYLHTDFMVNLSHLSRFTRGTKWNFFPYLGAGPIWRYRTKPVFDIAANAGFMVRRYINNMGDFYMDLKYVIIAPRIANAPSTSSTIYSTGIPMFTIGYMHNFGHSTTRYRMPVNSDIN